MPTRTPQLTPAQQQAFLTVQALRRLSIENHVSTTRSQNVVLQSLPPNDLIAVAAALANQAGER
jgi:hypothetical protein